MSFYSTCEGEIKYPNQETFDYVAGTLKQGFWVDEDGYFIDESHARICGDDADPNVNREALTITIPYSHYRNISRVEFFQHPEGLIDFTGVKGQIVGTSTDGCFEGWVIEDGKETSYNLTEWAAENMEDEDKVPPDMEDAENYCEWQSLVEQEFNTEFTPYGLL